MIKANEYKPLHGGYPGTVIIGRDGLKSVAQNSTYQITQKGQRYCWTVFNFYTGADVEHGEAGSYDQAFRDARNYIRHNQNKVYG